MDFKVYTDSFFHFDPQSTRRAKSHYISLCGLCTLRGSTSRQRFLEPFRLLEGVSLINTLSAIPPFSPPLRQLFARRLQSIRISEDLIRVGRSVGAGYTHEPDLSRSSTKMKKGNMP